MDSQKKPPLVLLVLDGWGVAPSGPSNPIEAAAAPTFKDITSNYPTITLRSFGESVGLSWGEKGNSEVGHLTIGAGRIYYQSLPRINLSIQSGDFFRNPALLKAAAAARDAKSVFHIVGIVSPGNVHGSDHHIRHLLDFAKQQSLPRVAVHAILDGRDTAFSSGVEFVRDLQRHMKRLGVGEIASISGRFYAMDRNKEWGRTQRAFQAMVGRGPFADGDAVALIEESYRRGVFDEQFEPVTLRHSGKPVGVVKSDDAVVFANFRPDRARQLCKTFTKPDFSDFPRGTLPTLHVVSMTEYEEGMLADVAFPAESIENCLAKVISDAGLKQLHVAETEKYGHVTFFFNGMREEPYPGEDRTIVPSLRVDSYDKAPEMSAEPITERVLQALSEGSHDVIVANFANADMVGHTGSFEATKKAVEIVDRCLGRITEAVLRLDGTLVITADHGNAEEVLNLRAGEIEIDKEHNANPVPFIVVGKRWKGRVPPSGESAGDAIIGGDLSLLPTVGILADVAPTVLKLIGIPQPPEMTGNFLL